VRVLGSPQLSAPNIKSAARDLLPMNAKVKIVGEENGFAKVADGKYLYAAHLTPLAEAQADWVGIAEKFLGAPYLWGGKTAAGCDCSGILQTALEAGGIWSPRDTDMMEEALGQVLPVSEDLSGLKRGDLVFWKGHIGVMLDDVRLLHANAYHMLVTAEPLRDAAERIARKEGAIRSIKRL
jgi:cell wall-associated NlpC family hydrolase